MPVAIIVKVARTGAPVQEVTLNENRTVADALTAAGVNKKDSEVMMVDDEEVGLDHELEDGDRVFLVKNIVGAVR